MIPTIFLVSIPFSALSSTATILVWWTAPLLLLGIRRLSLPNRRAA